MNLIAEDTNTYDTLLGSLAVSKEQISEDRYMVTHQSRRGNRDKRVDMILILILQTLIGSEKGFSGRL